MAQQSQFVERALALLDNGYNVVPVLPGKKAVVIDGWSTLKVTPALIKQWGANGYANGNIGIVTAKTPAIDLDIYDADVAEKMERWCLENISYDAPVRIGRAPKRLLLFRAEQTFPKLQATYVDSRGQKHKVEVLSDGQQFVAYGIHPDTKQPFRWVSMDQPLDFPVDSLPVLTQEDAERMIEAFKRIAGEAGWTVLQSSKAMSRGQDDALLSIKPSLRIDNEDIRAALAYTDPDAGYDTWMQTGMALHHQFNGDEDGLDMWDEWSQRSASYDYHEITQKWKSFSEMPDGRSPVTVATILKAANDAKRLEQDEAFNRVLNMIRTATDENDIFGKLAKEARLVITQDFQLDVVAKKMQDRVFELTEVRPRIETVRKALNKAMPRAESSSNLPAWCEGWVYLLNGDRFYNINTNVSLTERGFNAQYDRELLTEDDKKNGVAVPQSRAAMMAANVYGIPTAHNTAYVPGMPRMFEMGGKRYANTFDESSVPPSKLADTPEEFDAIAKVENHFKVMFPDERERALLLDYLAYNVQFPAEKIVWAVLVQGAEGSGKTWMSTLMSAVLGPENASPLSAASLQDTFTGWAEGRKMLFIEEIRLHGANRYEILDKMKEYVTNEQITVRKMQRERYSIMNVTNYMMFTNFWDALPLTKMNRRYLVVSTMLQTEADCAAFNAAYPGHFAGIFNAVYNHADVLRGWLMHRQLSPWFEPKRPALETRARSKMADTAESSEELDALEDLLAESTDPEVSGKLLNLSKLKAAFDMTGVQLPYGRALSAMLSKAGFHSLGRFTLPGQDKARYMTRDPGLFPAHGEIEVAKRIAAGTLVPAVDEIEW